MGWYCIKIGKYVEKTSFLSRFEPGICGIQIIDANRMMSTFSRNCGTKKFNYLEQIHSRGPTSTKTSKNPPFPFQVLWIQISQLRYSVLDHTNSVHILTPCLFFFHLTLLSLQRLNVSSKFLVQLFQLFNLHISYLLDKLPISFSCIWRLQFHF
jgi:hypothetical protein